MLYLACISCGEVFELNEAGGQAAKDHQTSDEHDADRPMIDGVDLFDGYEIKTEEEAF